MTPPASHTNGTTIAARATKQQPQKIAFQIFLRTGTLGQSSLPWRSGFYDPGGVIDDDAAATLPMLLMAYNPLTTGGAAPDSRRTSSRAPTLVTRVMTSSTKASSA